MTKYVRKYLQEVEVESMELNSEENGVKRYGITKYRNEFGSQCVMLTDDFLELYEEVKYDQ